MRRGLGLRALVVLADALVLVGALVVAWQIWVWWRPIMDQLLQVQPWHLLGFNDWSPPITALGVAWLVGLRSLGFYDPGRMNTAVRSLGALSTSVLWVLGLVFAFQFFAPQRSYSRFLVVAFLASGFVGLGLWRWILLRVQARFPLEQARELVAVYGVGEEAQHLAEQFDAQGHATWQLVGFVRPLVPTDEVVDPDRIVGGVDELRSLVNEHRLETLVLATRTVERDEALMLATRSTQMGLRVLQVPFTWGIVSPRLDLADLGDLQLIDLARLRYPTAAEYTKRAFDLMAVVLGGLVLLPIFLLTALAIRLDSAGPVLFAAPRVGQGGRTFPFFKFRSMFHGADDVKAELAEQNEADGPLFKITDDPRITRVGHFIRKYSLDEFPQFWNVIRGDMNLVGPRPLPVKDLEGIEDDPEIAYWFELRHQVPPGITGLWQVKGRSDLGFREMVRLDIHYVQNWSVWLDLKILLATVPAVLRGRGAR
ncbi:MAG: sugar transferase [Proteobacteria bacterium]|nr:sugar transferase [Pseudomonadota bacterium]